MENRHSLQSFNQNLIFFTEKKSHDITYLSNKHKQEVKCFSFDNIDLVLLASCSSLHFKFTQYEIIVNYANLFNTHS